MKKIKVLEINKMYYPVTGGVERVVQQIAEGLRVNEEIEVKVLACQKKGRGGTEIINGVEVHRAGSLGVLLSMPISFDFFRRFNRLKKDCDVINIHMPFPLADVAMTLFGFKGKVAIWWHSDIVKQKKLLFIYKPFLKKLLKRADVIIVATNGHIDGSDYLKAFREKCVIIPYGVDSGMLERANSIAIAPKVTGTPVQFLFVGRLVYYKGCGVLLDAFAKVRGAKLVIVGEGPLERELKKQAEQLGISNNVDFLGYVDDKELVQNFAECDVFVLPSIKKSEAFGLVQIEAMAFGKPVINTSLNSGVPYVSLDGITGFTVRPGDPEALAAAMRRLTEEPELLERLGKAAYKRAREEFSMEKMLKRVAREYYYDSSHVEKT